MSLDPVTVINPPHLYAEELLESIHNLLQTVLMSSVPAASMVPSLSESAANNWKTSNEPDVPDLVVA